MRKRLCMGIDEAGRGCVLGPMVVAGVVFEEDEKTFNSLRQYGVRDSKLLSAHQRVELLRVVRRFKYQYRTVSILPSLIDRHSLNALGMARSARLINALSPSVVYVDVPASGRGIERYIEKLEERVRVPNVSIVGGNHMESVHIEVAAASIVAKETREKQVRALHKVYGDFGSGYPHDPRTRAWLKAHVKTGRRWPQMVRTTWNTISQLT